MVSERPERGAKPSEPDRKAKGRFGPIVLKKSVVGWIARAFSRAFPDAERRE